MKITIIYDNESYKKGLKPDWGFSCLVEVENSPQIIFDLGADGRILLSNMEKLRIDPSSIDEVFISHSHTDHVGGLKNFLKRNKEVTLYAPSSFSVPYDVEEIISIKEAQQIHNNIFSTGELKGTEQEQSLVIKTGDEVVVVVGCSHPGVENILDAASKFGKPCALIGGLHEFDGFNLIEDLDLVCPAHCTKFKSEIKLQYPDKQIDAGVGRVIQL
ncbi:beta-lactamase [candidate division MSBL1 archaeon SCGC-AAA261F19]|uniref:Beta-lactamase n=1 Tax=candidate division MSBL1 archaeon SCGC-AAA261F19 TaxID=1698275 RepID=A0A133VAJ7_9EURY|nr:beta-lactamase [candidate division MSBL1 archaeon SCGC-AAA261F19]